MQAPEKFLPARAVLGVALQSWSRFNLKVTSFRSSKAAPEAKSVLWDPLAGVRSLEDFHMQFQLPICGYRSQELAAGTKLGEHSVKMLGP